MGVPDYIEVVELTHRFGFSPYRCFIKKARGRLYIEKLHFGDIRLEADDTFIVKYRHRLFGVSYSQNALQRAYDFFSSLGSDPDYYYLAWTPKNWAPLLLVSNMPLLDEDEGWIVHPEEAAIYFIAPIIEEGDGGEE